MAQASVSELVRRLEDELDTQLFVRGSRRLALTAAGAELTKAEASDLIEELQGQTGRGD